jgi:hypothetical protein
MPTRHWRWKESLSQYSALRSQASMTPKRLFHFGGLLLVGLCGKAGLVPRCQRRNRSIGEVAQHESTERTSHRHASHVIVRVDPARWSTRWFRVNYRQMPESACFPVPPHR